MYDDYGSACKDAWARGSIPACRQHKVGSSSHARSSRWQRPINKRTSKYNRRVPPRGDTRWQPRGDTAWRCSRAPRGAPRGDTQWHRVALPRGAAAGICLYSRSKQVLCLGICLYSRSKKVRCLCICLCCAYAFVINDPWPGSPGGSGSTAILE